MELAHLVHIVKAGGVQALLGAITGAFLGWPREQTGPGGDRGLTVTTYHNLLGVHGATPETAVESVLAPAVVLGVVGLALGALAVWLGLASKDELGSE